MVAAVERAPFIQPKKAAGEFKIELTPPQHDVLTCLEKLVWFVGGVGSGKTAIGALYALRKAQSYPKAMGFIGANTYKQLYLSTLPPFMKMLSDIGMPYVFNRRPPASWPTFRTLPRYDGVFTLANGAQIYTYSLENFEVYRGIQIAWFWVDETSDSSEDALSVLFERLRGFDIVYPEIVYQGLFTGTPNGFDPMWKKFASKDRLPGTRYVQAPTASNSANLPPDYVADLEARLGKKLAQQQLYADFVSLTKGRMFSFRRQDHVRPCEYEPRLPLVFSMDFNVAPMAASVMQVETKERRAWVLDEIYIPDDAQTRVACEEFARRWGGTERVGGKSKRAVLFWGDRAGGHRDTRGNESDLEIMAQILREHFVSVREGSDRAQRFVVDGVNSVNALFDPLKGEPRLFVDPRCEMLIQDLEQLAWKEGTKVPDETDKQRKHFADTIRYPLAQLFPVQGELTDRAWATGGIF